MLDNNLSKFTQKLQYDFKNKEFFEESLNHRSFVNEQNADIKDNERLEFLGDAVLGLVIAHILMDRYPYLKEGNLTMIRSALVNEKQLASIARSLNLGDCILLGKGEEQTKGREKDSILSNVFEAVIAAIYLDGGYDAVFKVIDYIFLKKIKSVVSEREANCYKSQLQELVQAVHYNVPCYDIINESGPDHDKIFMVELKIGKFTARGVGKSKKRAEQDAARLALEIIQKEGI